MDRMDCGSKAGALYIRVSTEMQEELSPDAQRRLLLDYAKQHGISVAAEHIFQDDGISGRKAGKRPEFMRMIGLAKEKEKPFSVILVWKYSRFARNQEESIVYKSLLRKNGVDVVSISEPLIDGVFGSLIERIIEWMDEYYSIRLSGEVFRGMSEAALRGRYLARPPLGYRIGQPKQPPSIVPEEAEVVRQIFDWYVNGGLGIYAITKRLNSLGLKTSRGKPFEKRGVTYILQNPAYSGTLRWNRTENATNRIKDKSEWIMADGNYPAIIPKDIFEAAQKRYESEYRPKHSRPPESHRHWLSGLVKCSACGRSLSTSIHTDSRYGRKYVNFQCYGYSKGKCATSHSVSETKLSAIVLGSFRELLESDSISYSRKCPKEKDSTPAILREQLARLAAKEERVRAAYEDGIDTLDEYRANRERIKAERLRLEQHLASYAPLSKAEGDAFIRAKIKSVLDVLTNPDADVPTKSNALRSVCEKIIFDKQAGAITLYLYLAEPA